MTMSDPILHRILTEDVDEFDACLRAIIAMNEEAAAGIASLDFVPEDVMRELVGHESSDVRQALARNLLCPSDILAGLAADSEDSVRLSAVRNPAATDEVRAVFSLMSTPEEVALAGAAGEEGPREENLPLVPEELRIIADDELSKDYLRRDWDLLESLVANPALPQEVRLRLTEAGVGSQGWGRNDQLWPSTHAFLSESAPEELTGLLARHGHPAALLYLGATAAPSSVDSALGLKELINSGLLVRALWRELALAGTVELKYKNTYDGDRFFPVLAGLKLMEEDSLAEDIIRNGSHAAREWIALSNSLDDYRAIQLGSDEFEAFFHECEEDFNEDYFELFVLCGVAWVTENQGYETVRWTPAGQAAMESQLRDLAEVKAQRPHYDTKVQVAESRLPDIGYAESSDNQKYSLTDLISQARRDSMVKTWGLSDHFLMCIALHPATPQSLRAQLLEDDCEGVREAARLGSERAISH